MAIQNDRDVRKTDSLNGFLHRWRRNASQAGVVTAVVTRLRDLLSAAIRD